MKLSKEAFARARQFVKTTARSLDRSLFAYYFENGKAEAVLEELAVYQNKDGGFGKWLESDFVLDTSSPSASVEAFHYIEKVNASAALPMIQQAINYFVETFHQSEQRWFAVPKEVNDFPHAPWWHYDTAFGGCQIDQNIGNPSAEIVGYLNKYWQNVPVEFLTFITDTYITKLGFLAEDADSIHEIFCYMAMCERLPNVPPECVEKVRCLIKSNTQLRPEQWNQYCATPLFYVERPLSPFYDLFPEAIENNLDYIVKTQQKNGSWQPNWSWGQFEDTWEEARKRWAGYLTVKNLKILADFHRVE